MLTASLLAVLMQVGPNPASSSPISAVPPELQEQREIKRQNEAIVDVQTPERLTGCLARADKDAPAALLEAQSWRERAAGAEIPQALHCRGYAHARLSQWDDAARNFLDARKSVGDSDVRYRARLGAIAGNALLSSGDFPLALTTLDLAGQDAATADFARLSAEIAIDRARALVELGEPEQATEALAAARQLAPQSAQAWLLSAVLARRMAGVGDDISPARTYIAQAVKLDFANPEILLEAGVIAALSGDEAAAKEHWDRLTALFPGSPEFATAQSYLKQLEAR